VYARRGARRPRLRKTVWVIQRSGARKTAQHRQPSVGSKVWS
jgi:hypothetical protein